MRQSEEIVSFVAVVVVENACAVDKRTKLKRQQNIVCLYCISRYNRICFVYLQGRIKKIMQSDEDVGKVAQAVPIIIYILFQ